MPHSINLAHKVPFYAGVTGLTFANFVVDIFTIDGSPVDTVTLATLTVQELSGGYYQALYIPSFTGFYYLALHDGIDTVRVIDGVDIDDGEAAVSLTQDTPTTGALKPVDEGDELDEFLLLVIQSSDWQVGRTSARYAVASTQLDVDGNWLATPLIVSPGTYHIVIMNNFGKIRVIRPFLTVQ